MKSAEVTDKVLEAIESGEYGFIRCNYPNGDMVGHTGDFRSTMIGVESVDLGLSRILKAMDSHDFTLIVTADHGNADDMIERNKKTGAISPKTSHSLNPVPFIIYDKDTRYEMKDGNFGLANCAATVAKILGLKAPEMWEEAIIK